MNTNGTEYSIFQGAPSIHVDNNQQRIEEAEALEDQIRRHAELNAEIQDAFADLEADDDVNETMNSTKFSNGNSYQDHSKIPVAKGINHNHQYQREQPFPLRDRETHLKNQLDEKAREIEYVTSELKSEKKKHKSAIDEYEKRLAIAEAEKERALMTRNQSHELLVESKGKANEIREDNEKLRSKIKALETENSSLVGELETTKLMLTDVQMKYNMVEKNVIYKADRNTDNILKQAQEKHSAVIAMMQQQIDGFRSKFDELEHEHKNLEIRYKELHRSRESLLIEKSETVNQLNKNLEDAQRQCHDLLSRPNYSHENRQLQHLIHSMESDKTEMSRTINKLQKRLQEQTDEMELMDSVVQECGGNNFTFSESTKFIHRDPLKNKNSSTPIAPEARFSRVKEELCKSLNNIKTKREEIKILEQQLRVQDDEIKQLKIDENKALVQMNQFRDEKIRLESKTKILENELEKARQLSNNHTCAADEKHEESLKNLQEQCEKLQEELNSVKADYETLTMQNVELAAKEKECRDKINQLNVELSASEMSEDLRKEREKVQALEESLKKHQTSQHMVDRSAQGDFEDLPRRSSTANAAKTCSECDENLLKLEKLEITCLQMQNANANNLTELARMKNELNGANQEIKNLGEKLNLKELRDQEIVKLQRKAEEFEEFMRTNNQRTSAASSLTMSQTKSDVSTETSDLEEDSSRKLRQIETKVRDEMAKIFAAEMKSAERRFREDVENLQNRIILVTETLEEKANELNIRNEQLQMLKFTILKEREESENRLKEKDEDFKMAIEKYRVEHENNHQQIEDLIAQLKENKELMKEERLSIKTLKSHFDEERATFKKHQEEAAERYKKLEQEDSKLIKELNAKFLTQKNIAENYKQYATDKENHFRSEFERNRKIFLEVNEKTERRLKESLKEKDKECQEKLKKMEAEFDYKVEVLKGMLQKKS